MLVVCKMSHTSQELEEAADWYWPCAQSLHGVEPVSLANLPGKVSNKSWVLLAGKKAR